MDEQAQIKRCQKGDVTAFEPLFRAHLASAVRTAYLITRDWATAEDAAQEAFVRAFGSIGSFRSDQPFGPWLYRIVVNEARRVAARGGRNLPVEVSDETMISDQATPEQAALEGERRSMVWTAIQSLKEDQRTVLVLKYFNRFSEVEIASVLELPQSTVKSRLYEARQKLADRLGPWKEATP